MRSWSVFAELTWEIVASIVAPARCAACDACVAMRAAFCAECAATVEVDPPGRGSAGVAAFVYGGAIARSIALFKYHQRPDLARPLGDLLWRAVAPRAAEWRDPLLVPVPLHPSRLAERGYNQSALLARRLGRRWGAPVLATALARTRDAPPQAKLDRDARLSNLEGAFAAREPKRVRGRTIVLVDDVRTTGATIQACASALLDAGARSAHHAVVARAQGGL